MLRHDNNPKSHIAITSTESDDDRRFSFSYCETKEETSCTRIGRYDSYHEAQLLALAQSYHNTARVVLWTELVFLLSIGVSLAYYALKDQKSSAGSFAAPPAIAPDGGGTVKSYFSHLGVSQIIGPAIGAVFWGLKEEFTGRFQAVLTLSIRFLSPAEHFRAATLISDITHTTTNLHYSQREFATIEEYFHQYPVEDLQHLKIKLEDLLAVAPR